MIDVVRGKKHMQTLRPRDVHTALALIAHPDLCEYVITYHGNLTGKWFKADVDARKVENDEDESSEEVDHSGGDAFSSTADPFSSTPGAFSSFGHSASSATSSSTAKAALEPSSGLVVAGKKKSLIFPVGRLRLSCNQKAHSMRLQASGIVFIASAMQAVAELVLKGATEAATEQQRVRVIPRHILLSIRGHTHLSAFFRNAMIPGAGIVPQMLGQVLDNDLGRPMKKGSGILDSDSEDL